jgi:membrane protein YdbS with pleckstrin-like domain
MTVHTDPSNIRLRPPRHPVDPRTVTWWRTNLTLAFAAPIVVLVVLGALIPPARWWLLGPAAALAAIAVPVIVLLPRWWFRVHRWEITDTAVYTRSGHFWQEWRAAPLSRIQTVDTDRGPIQRHFGLATLTVTTASAKGSVKVKGLDDAEASELAEHLTRATEAVPGDAT